MFLRIGWSSVFGPRQARATGYGLRAGSCLSGRWSLVARRWSLVAGRWSLTVGWRQGWWSTPNDNRRRRGAGRHAQGRPEQRPRPQGGPRRPEGARRQPSLSLIPPVPAADGSGRFGWSGRRRDRLARARRRLRGAGPRRETRRRRCGPRLDRPRDRRAQDRRRRAMAGPASTSLHGPPPAGSFWK